MRRVATQWAVVLGLAAAATLQVAGSAWAMGGCHPGDTLRAERQGAGCCDRKKTDRLTELGGDCCNPAFLTDEEPAAGSGGGTQVPLAPSAWLAVEQSLLAVTPAAERSERAWRRSWELPPPLAPPTENVVLLN